MAGRGPRPKDPSKRARVNADPVALKVYEGKPVDQPALPDDRDWPSMTLRWWDTWGNEPASRDFRPTDWDFLADTALIHAQVWAEGDLKLLPELRLRVAKMGATAEDRARLRITYAQADEADERRGAPKRKSRHSGLRLAE